MFAPISQIQFPWVGRLGRRTLCVASQLVFGCDLVLSFYRGRLGFGSVLGVIPGAGVIAVGLALEPVKYSECTCSKVYVDHCLCILIFTSAANLLFACVLWKLESIDLMAPYVFICVSRDEGLEA